ncbi:MAG: hypothetical protein MAG715_00636 [Methanonatronarchaeales archaeon]|nr:hypothetical protein [Methanonatronarchaeales archaeon]
MNCSFCGFPLERPGDLCLVCGERNAEAAAVLFGEDLADVRFYLDGERVAAERVPASYRREERRERQVAFRNHVSLVEELLYRRRPDRVYVGGPRDAVKELRSITSLEVVRLCGDLFGGVKAELSGAAPLDEVEASPGSKFGGSHISVVGGGDGTKLLIEVAHHPNVKRIIPAAISARGTRGGGTLRFGVTRVDDRENLKALLKSGASV